MVLSKLGNLNLNIGANMKFVKFLPHAIIIGCLAALLQYIDLWTTGASYHVAACVAFQAWALYFLAGCDLKGGGKSLAGWICGIIAAIIIIKFGLSLSSLGSAAFPVAVFVIASFVILFEKVPYVDFIPAWFVSAGAYFAFTNVPDYGVNHSKLVPLILISGIVGFIFGWVTVFLRGKYAALVEEPAEETPEEAT